MALAFPAGPIAGQQYTGPNGVVYEWDATAGVWIKVNAVQTVTSGSTAATGAARIPTGNTAARPAATLAAGQFRYNTQIPQLEYSDGTSWLPVGGGLAAATLAQAQAGSLTTVAATPETAVPKNASGMAGSAFIPAGNTAARPAFAAYVGQLRYNTQTPEWEYSDGAAWLPLVSAGLPAATLAQAAAGTLASVANTPVTSVPKDASGMTGAALIPGGNNAARPATPVTGMFRYNSQAAPASMEFWDGTAWSAVGGVPAASLAEAAAGTINTKFSSPQTAVPKDASGMTGAALLPTGTAAQQPATPVAGMLRMNTTCNPDSLEAYDGTTSSWRQVAYEPVRTALPSYTATNGTALPSSGTYDCITIPAGVTVTSNGISRLCAITCVTIDGTINSNGLGFRGPANSLTNNNALIVGSASPLGQGFGAARACCGGNSYGWASLTPSTGTAGAVSVFAGTGIAGYAGDSGGVVIIASDGPITVGAAALVSANGTNALPASIQGGTSGAEVGGGGGSSGGMIALQSKTSLTLAAGAQLCVAGSAGSNGVFSALTGAGGGGGGGGGYIILNSPTTTDASTKVVSGGAAGSTTGGVATPGGGGGGWGGGGGRGGQGVAAAAGSAGQIVLNSYL